MTEVTPVFVYKEREAREMLEEKIREQIEIFVEENKEETIELLKTLTTGCGIPGYGTSRDCI